MLVFECLLTWAHFIFVINAFYVGIIDITSYVLINMIKDSPRIIVCSLLKMA